MCSLYVYIFCSLFLVLLFPMSRSNRFLLLFIEIFKSFPLRLVVFSAEVEILKIEETKRGKISSRQKVKKKWKYLQLTKRHTIENCSAIFVAWIPIQVGLLHFLFFILFYSLQFSSSHFLNFFPAHFRILLSTILQFTFASNNYEHTPSYSFISLMCFLSTRNINGYIFFFYTKRTFAHIHARNVNVANITLYYVQLTINGLDFLHFSRWIDFVWMLLPCWCDVLSSNNNRTDDIKKNSNDTTANLYNERETRRYKHIHIHFDKTSAQPKNVYIIC